MARSDLRPRPVRAGHPRAGDDLGRSGAPTTSAGYRLTVSFSGDDEQFQRIARSAIERLGSLNGLLVAPAEFESDTNLTSDSHSTSQRPATASQPRDSEPPAEPGA